MALPDVISLSIAPDPNNDGSSPSRSQCCNADEQSNVPHRSHDPGKNLKRNDPFKFGSRYLEEGDNVYEFNAWDHVTPDDAYYEYAETQYANQREHPVSEFDKHRFNSEPEKWWNKFYSNNTSNFFKDRKWLHQEFPILSRLTKEGAGKVTILEVGAGAGNTAFPILAGNENKDLMLFACDFSQKAVDLIRDNEAFDERKIRAEVWDIAGGNLPSGVEVGSVDVVLLIFIFSALDPRQWAAAVMNVWKALKPGGEVCFRDYGRGDMTQVRFKKGRLLEESFYIRGDGTRVYFFDTEEIRGIWSGNLAEHPSVKGDARDHDLQPTAEDVLKPNFTIVSLDADRRMLVNRQKQLKMYRCWLQGRFVKPHPERMHG